MAEPFLGEIRIFTTDFAPRSWAFCNGQTLVIQQNSGLFGLLHSSFGGDGITNFALPNLQGRLPMCAPRGIDVGLPEGTETHTLTLAQMPAHKHDVSASSVATGGSTSPAGRYLGGANNAYSQGPATTPLQGNAVSATGSNQPHNNMQPYLALNFCIAVAGIYPSAT